MSNFGTLNTAVTGLLAAQRAIAATGQNVVNANTPGYSRQRVNLASVGPTTTATFHTGHDNQLAGVRVADVTRVKNAFIEATRAAAGARQNALDSQSSMISGAQRLISEPGEVGLQAGLDTFYNAWHDLSLNPSDGAAASVVLQQGQAVASKMHMITDGLSRQWNSAHDNLANVVTQTNRAAADLASVNSQILQSTAGGGGNSELLDKRDALVRSLADLVGGVGHIDDHGLASVSVGGLNLISGTTPQTFTLTGATDLTLVGGNPPGLTWNGVTVPVEGGSAAGFLASLRSDLPGLRSQLDDVAVALRDAVNSVHQNGFTLGGAPGGAFFTGTDAASIAVVPTQGSELAMASASGVVDGSNARKIGDLADDAKSATVLGGGSSAGKQWQNMVTKLGVTVSSLDQARQTQSAVLSTADDAVTADSGVNLDEEMTNMLTFQRAYQASARVITTVDEMLDTLVSKTGLVGR